MVVQFLYHQNEKRGKDIHRLNSQAHVDHLVHQLLTPTSQFDSLENDFAHLKASYRASQLSEVKVQSIWLLSHQANVSIQFNMYHEQRSIFPWKVEHGVELD